MRSSLLTLVTLTGHHALTQAADISNLASTLQTLSTSIFPSLQSIATSVWSHPEIGLDEHYAHDLVIDYFTNTLPNVWDTITPHAFGLDTAWRLEFSTSSTSSGNGDEDLPVIGFLAEYDALVGIGHACGHNQILLTALTAASLTRQALLDLSIPGRVVVLGTPDEENAAGKCLLRSQSGGAAFEGVDVWMMAHPTNANAVQPMNARVNAITDFKGVSHEEAVRRAYGAMVAVRDLVAQGGLPGTSSSVVAVEEVGMFECNIVQGQISLGIRGVELDVVKQTVEGLLGGDDGTYPGVSFTAVADEDGHGVNVTALGPGGHASESTKGPLVLTVETFRALSGQDGVEFYLPGNTTLAELGVVFDIRSRYTQDLDLVLESVEATIKGSSGDGGDGITITTDTVYPALEVTPFLPELFTSLLATPEYGSQTDFPISTFAPASTDAGCVQQAVVDPDSRKLVGSEKVVFHPNYNICDAANSGGKCAFNHEPGFAMAAGTDYAYQRTEVIARAIVPAV
ncbi:hypothetical protein B0J18DRAFT_452591 [Chaetomium sp. MPI-SDFR-AT-0129]|nr:hypothetical protein B0J18DRAFT_452591 [Chaetomium sp. MPI-SDFR-AT-0129]